jgi:hypothetical protein
MNKNIKWISLIGGGGLMVAVLAAVFAFGFTSNAWAQDAAPEAADPDIFGHRGGRGFPGAPAGRFDQSEYLLEVLGISADELQAAVQEAGKAALENAVAEGRITQEQVDALLNRGFDGRSGMLGGRMGFAEGSEHLTYLADALDISVEELQSALDDAQAAGISAAVEDGKLTQEQADMMSAMGVLKEYVDPQALFEDVTGMTVEQFREARQAAYQEAVQDAVEAGVITQEQADRILEGPFGGQGAAPFFKGPGGRGGMGLPGGMQGMPRFNTPSCTDTTSQ